MLICVSGISFAYAQIDTDGTLGPAEVLEGPNYKIGEELGQQHGGNLFHSFGQFNIHQGESATFTGPDTVDNIVSRVTGGSASTIDGVLRSEIPDANMYLLNPAGIMFGENTKLEVDGSFHASTADTLRLGEDGEFNAKFPEQSRLSVASPSAFGFLGENPSGIRLENAELSVKEGEAISLIGGEIRMDGQPSIIIASNPELLAGQINLVSLDSYGEVVSDEYGFKLSDEAQGGEITIDNMINIAKEGGIYIRCGQLELIRSVLHSTTDGGKAIDIQTDNMALENGAKIYGKGGDIAIKVNNTLSASGASPLSGGSSIVASSSDDENKGKVGDIKIEANKIILKEGARIKSEEGGNIIIEVDDTLLTSGRDSFGAGGIHTSPLYYESNVENTGNIDIKADQITLTDGAEITTSNTNAQGATNRGKIFIRVNDTLTISGKSGIYTESHECQGGLFCAESNGEITGNSTGDIDLEAKEATLMDGAKISSSTWGPVGAGNINIKTDRLTISGTDESGDSSGIFSKTHSTGKSGDIGIEAVHVNVTDRAEINNSTAGTGNGGLIEIHTDNITLTEKVKISSNTSGSGNSGRIFIKANDKLLISGIGVEFGKILTGIFAFSLNTGDNAGKAGDIEIEAHEMELNDGAKIANIQFGSGGGGSVIIRVTDGLILSGAGSGIFSNLQAADTSEYKAGSIEIEANQLTINGGALISSMTDGSGDGGSIVIKVADKLTISGKYEFAPGNFSSSGIAGNSNNTGSNSGDAGNLEIEARNIVITDGAQINSFTEGGGEGGTIVIKTAGTLSVSGSDEKGFSTISTDSLCGENYAGKAGSIEIEAHQIKINNGAQIKSTTSGGGKGGSVIIVADDALILSGWPEYEIENDSGIYCNSEKEDGNGGDAGDIEIKAGQLILKDGAKIASDTHNSGKGGSITIVADTLTASGNRKDGTDSSGILANSLNEDNGGDTGYIKIEARQITLLDGGLISSSTIGSGNGDSIIIKVSEELIASGEPKVGNANSGIHARSNGTGRAGKIELQANTVKLTDGGTIATTANNSSGGDIAVKTSNSIYLRKGVITTSVQGGDGTGGDITIDHPVFIILDNSKILANAHEGTGGNMTIVADQFIKDPNSKVDASSELGIDGTVNIDAPDTDISGSITLLPATFSDAASLLHESCSTRTKETTSSLVNTGIGGSAMAPDDFFPSTFHQDRKKPSSDEESQSAE